ncbi:O-antigen ligase like membrane protein [Thermoflexibacter ruber]|uniref:O-antigen ligase like membrane protein n=2 Tax=Thermoflexibacter ruber TaxID=1003 RepID=A0A1I2JZV8_9BACT|nr:O-antigen ligase like membrane protein [Thermoflexibacter ruber]
MLLVMLNNETVLALAGLSEGQVSKPSGVFVVAATFLFLREFSPFMKKWLIIVTIYLLILMLESYHDYHTFFKYPHVFLKIFDIYLLFFIYSFYKKHLDKVPFVLHFTVWLILIIYIVAAFTIRREVFSMSAFTNNKRGFNSAEIYIFIICLTYFFNLYFYKKNFINIILFFVVFSLIIFSQQKTVWTCAAFSQILNILFIRRSNFKIDFAAIAPVLLMIGIVAFIVSSVILTNEEIRATFEKRIKAFTEVENDEEGGTAAWRRRQWEAYLPIVEQNILTGLRLKGFELPGQFDAFTAENTGHHFHSYYLDKLFYFGIFGLFSGVVLISFYTLKLIFFVRKFITLEQIVLASYMMTFAVYSIGYDIPFAIYGLIGLGFAYLEKDYTDTDKKRKVTEKSIAISQ